MLKIKHQSSITDFSVAICLLSFLSFQRKIAILSFLSLQRQVAILNLLTGKSLSEELILASTNPQYDKRLFIDLPVQYMKTTSSEHVVYINCSECQNKNKKQFVYTTCSELGIFMYWTCNSMNNLLSYCGLNAARISASEKDLPVSSSGRVHFRSWYFHSSVNLHSSFISSVNLQSPATWSATSKYRARFDEVDMYLLKIQF